MIDDPYQAVRAYAFAELDNVADRKAFVAQVVDLFGAAGSVERMMAERIAAHAWDSTPHKVLFDHGTHISHEAPKARAAAGSAGHLGEGGSVQAPEGEPEHDGVRQSAADPAPSGGAS